MIGIFNVAKWNILKNNWRHDTLIESASIQPKNQNKWRKASNKNEYISRLDKLTKAEWDELKEIRNNPVVM